MGVSRECLFDSKCTAHHWTGFRIDRQSQQGFALRDKTPVRFSIYAVVGSIASLIGISFTGKKKLSFKFNFIRFLPKPDIALLFGAILADEVC